MAFRETATPSNLVMMFMSSVVVLAFVATTTEGQTMTNLKYLMTANTWQADVGLHNVINSQSIIRDVECANYCTVRDSRFRKVVSSTPLTH